MLTNGALATANQQRPEGRTEPFGSCLPAATKEAHKRRPRHSEQQGPEARTGPAGNGPQCLTLLSEPTRKLAVFQPPRKLTNGALATAKQQGPEGRTGPAGNGPQCLTLLSEPTRKLAVFQPPTRLTNGALAHKRRPCHSEPAAPWGTDRALR